MVYFNIVDQEVIPRASQYCIEYIVVLCSLFFFSDAILTMVNNIAANVLGGKPELEDGAQIEGIHAFL